MEGIRPWIVSRTVKAYDFRSLWSHNKFRVWISRKAKLNSSGSFPVSEEDSEKIQVANEADCLSSVDLMLIQSPDVE